MIQQRLVNEISLYFPEFCIIGKHVKIRFKDRVSSCYFLCSRGQKVKNITKIEWAKETVFVYILGFSFYGVSRDKTDLLSIWFNKIFWTRSINDTHRERLAFHSIQYRNGWLAAFDLFHMFTQSIQFYTFHYRYRCLKNVIPQVDSKHGWLLLSVRLQQNMG